jgi:hypothetical protein
MSTSYPPITLHLGAHRTATTRLQKTLDNNRSVINSAPTGEAIEYALSNKRTNSFDPDSVLKRFASGRPFSPLTKEELERLGQNFLSDLKTINELTHTHSANIKIHKLPDRC